MKKYIFNDAYGSFEWAKRHKLNPQPFESGLCGIDAPNSIIEVPDDYDEKKLIQHLQSCVPYGNFFKD